MLHWQHGRPFIGGVDSCKCDTNLLHIAQVALDMLASEKCDVEPQMLAIRRFDAFALADSLNHAARNNVAARELFFLGFIVGHEAIAIDIAQKPAITAATFGEQDSRWEKWCGVELHGFHIAKSCDACFKRNRSACAFANHGVCGVFVDSAIATCGNQCAFGNIRGKLACYEVADNRAIATFVLVNQRNRFFAVANVNIALQALVGNGKEHGVPCGVSGVACAPFLCAPKVA